MSTSMTLRLPDDLVQQIDALAKEIDRPKTYIVKTALEEFFEEYADYYIALHRLHDKNDKILTEAEAREVIGI